MKVELEEVAELVAFCKQVSKGKVTYRNDDSGLWIDIIAGARFIIYRYTSGNVEIAKRNILEDLAKSSMLDANRESPSPSEKPLI